MKTCKKHIKDPVGCYSTCAGCEMQRLTDERNQFKTAYNEWMDKMAWARTWNSPSELGKHIADVTKARVDALIAENEALRKGWYLNECGDNKFWPEEMEELKAESEALRKAITDIDDALYREYWSEYAGLENTRAILDAAMRKDGQS